MGANRFDDLTRTLAERSGTRRGLGRVLAGGSAAAALARLSGAAEAKPDKGDKKSKDPACRSEGHPCEGNQVCCAGLTCGPSGPGAANRCSAPAPASAVVAVAAYRVDVACTYDAGSDRSTCVCTAVAPSGAPAVRSVAVAASAVCADVVGGDSALGTPGPAVGAAGFTSANGQAALTLILTGQVTTGGSATYWCQTDAGAVPAPGPGLMRQQTDRSTTTGSVEVRTSDCDVAAPGPKGYDWHGQCSHPGAGARFTLAPAGGGAQTTGTAASDGRVVFGQLSPGTYQLKQTGKQWCHAESDGVDASGNVIVKANARTTVWIFDCASGGS